MMTLSPLNLEYDSQNGLQLTVKIAFNRRAHTYCLKGKKYKDHIQQAVEEKWSNTYIVTAELKNAIEIFVANKQLNPIHLSKLPFKVNILVDSLSGRYHPRLLYFFRFLKREQRPIPIFLKNYKIMPSHVASGLARRFWGIFRYGRIVSLGYNWSKNFPGYAVIKQYRNAHILHSISAHEFGHLFGIGDAYAAWYRLYHSAPETSNFMMHHNKEVQSQEIAMLIKAYSTNRIQFFPIEFNWQNIKAGLSKSIKSFLRKIKNIAKP